MTEYDLRFNPALPVPPPEGGYRTTPSNYQFGDTVMNALAEPLAAMGAYSNGLWDAAQSPSYAATPEDWNPGLRRIYSKPADAAMAVLSALSAGYNGAAELAGELIGGTPAEKAQLARDLVMMGEVSAPEIRGISALSFGKYIKISQEIPENALASRSAHLYNPPTKSEVGDVLGRSDTGGFDLEGRPLVAKYVVGRAPERVLEQSLHPEATSGVVEGVAGFPIEAAPRTGKNGTNKNDGVAYFGGWDGAPTRALVANDLDPISCGRVSQHEAGHVIDILAGQIPDAGLNAELRELYSYGQADGFSGRYRQRNFTTPEHMGYRKSQVREERMAEAIRAYMAAPDTMKAHHPKTAAAIRAAVNGNPKLNKFIQFNALGGAG